MALFRQIHRWSCKGDAMSNVARNSLLLFATIGLGLVGLARAQSGDAVPEGHPAPSPGVLSNLARHHQVMMFGVPAPYRNLSDPLPRRPAELRRGAALFDRHCAACHGLSGMGDGPAGKGLDPAPANLSWLAHMPMDRSAPYMDWTIAEGGGAFGSDMPAFKHIMSKSDIRAVIAYVQFGPAAQTAPAPQ